MSYLIELPHSAPKDVSSCESSQRIVKGSPFRGVKTAATASTPEMTGLQINTISTILLVWRSVLAMSALLWVCRTSVPSSKASDLRLITAKMRKLSFEQYELKVSSTSVWIQSQEMLNADLPRKNVMRDSTFRSLFGSSLAPFGLVCYRAFCPFFRQFPCFRFHYYSRCF